MDSTFNFTKKSNTNSNTMKQTPFKISNILAKKTVVKFIEPIKSSRNIFAINEVSQASRDIDIGTTTIRPGPDEIVITDLLTNCKNTFDITIDYTEPNNTSGLISPITIKIVNNTDGTLKTYIMTDLSSPLIISNNKRGSYVVIVTDNFGHTDIYTFVIVAPNLCGVCLIPKTQSLKCNGSNNGELTAELVLDQIPGYSWCNGITTYFYSWARNNNGIETYIDPATGKDVPSQIWTPNANHAINLSIGQYTVCVYETCSSRDQSVIKTSTTVCDSATICQPSSLVLELCPTKVCLDCYGGRNGEIRAWVTGGTPPYLYTLYILDCETGSYDTIINGPNGNYKQTNLSAGSYTLVVYDSNGCSISKMFSIKQPPKLEVLISVSRICESTCKSSCEPKPNDFFDCEHDSQWTMPSEKELEHKLGGDLDKYTNKYIERYIEKYTSTNISDKKSGKCVTNRCKENGIKLCADVCGGYYCSDSKCTTNKCAKCFQFNKYTYEWKNISCGNNTILGTGESIIVHKDGIYQVKVFTSNGCCEEKEIKIKLSCLKVSVKKYCHDDCKFKIRVCTIDGIGPYMYEVYEIEGEKKVKLNGDIEMHYFLINKRYRLNVIDSSTREEAHVEF